MDTETEPDFNGTKIALPEKKLKKVSFRRIISLKIGYVLLL